MTTKIEPAEVFIINRMKGHRDGVPPTPKQVEGWLIEFASLHVEEALKEASRKFDSEWNKEAVLRSYPIKKIQ